MKKPVLILIILLSTSTAFSQERRISYSFGSGWNIPSSPREFKDGWKFGFNVRGAAYYKLNNNIYAGVQTGWYFFRSEFGIFLLTNSDYSRDGGSISVLTVMPGILYKFFSERDRSTPFIEIGLGLFRLHKGELTTIDGDIHATEASLTDNNIGFRAGGGFEINQIGRYKIVVDVEYFIGSTESKSSEFLSAGIRLKF
ncbi:outer membrane beta-barrel protein [candidate division KSB1 bacterium]